MKLSIIIPCFNEELTIKNIVSKIKNTNLDNVEKEIIIVNDGSSDNSYNIIKNINGIIVINNIKNIGKGASIIKAIKIATGKFVIIQDADLEYDPNDIKKLLLKAKKENSDVVYGSRILNKSNKYSTLSFYYGGRLISFITNLVFNSSITDQPTCYKLINTELIKSLNLKRSGFEFCSEVTSKLLKKKIKIFEVPINYYPRTSKDGKKIKWTDGLIAIYVILRIKILND